MGFFDNFGSKLSKMGNSISSQASTSLESTSLSSENRNLTTEINTIFRKIGEEVYASHKNGTDPELTDYFARLGELEDQIESNRKRIEELKSYIKCPNCGKSIAPDSEFCPFCGMPLAAAEQNQEQSGDTQYCPNCGQPMIPGTVFCTSCGYRLGTPLPPKEEDGLQTETDEQTVAAEGPTVWTEAPEGAAFSAGTPEGAAAQEETPGDTDMQTGAFSEEPRPQNMQ